MIPAPTYDQNRFNELLSAGRFAEAVELMNQPAPVQAPPTQPQPQPQSPSIEDRVGALEKIVQQVAAPVLNEATQIGMAIMEALGKAMTEKQASWVQQRLNTSPGFFGSQNCKDAIDIFISEWQSYENGRTA